MKNSIILLPMLILGTVKVSAQDCNSIIQFAANATFYAGIENQISTIHINQSLDDLILESDNGKVIEDSSNFYFTPDSAGVAHFKLTIRQSEGDPIVLAKFNVKVVNIPSPRASISTLRNGENLKIRDLLYEKGLRVILDLPIQVAYQIDSFSIAILRNGRTVFFENNIGSMFSDNFMNQIKNSKTGDVLLFYDVMATNRNDATRSVLSPIVYTLKAE